MKNLEQIKLQLKYLNSYEVSYFISPSILDILHSNKFTTELSTSFNISSMTALHIPFKSYLETGMTAKVQERLHNLKMTFIDRDMQRSLPTLIASIQVGAASVQDFDNSTLISKSCMVNSSISIFILNISMRVQSVQLRKKSWSFKMSRTRTTSEKLWKNINKTSETNKIALNWHEQSQMIKPDQ